MEYLLLTPLSISCHYSVYIDRRLAELMMTRMTTWVAIVVVAAIVVVVTKAMWEENKEVQRKTHTCLPPPGIMMGRCYGRSSWSSRNSMLCANMEQITYYNPFLCFSFGRFWYMFLLFPVFLKIIWTYSDGNNTSDTSFGTFLPTYVSLTVGIWGAPVSFTFNFSI